MDLNGENLNRKCSWRGFSITHDHLGKVAITAVVDRGPTTNPLETIWQCCTRGSVFAGMWRLVPSFQKNLPKPGNLWQGWILWKVTLRGSCIMLGSCNLSCNEDSGMLRMPGLHPKEEPMCTASDRGGGVGLLNCIEHSWWHQSPRNLTWWCWNLGLPRWASHLLWIVFSLLCFYSFFGNGDVYSGMLYIESV